MFTIYMQAFMYDTTGFVNGLSKEHFHNAKLICSIDIAGINKTTKSTITNCIFLYK